MLKIVNIQAFGIKYESYILIEDINDLNFYYEKYKKRQISNAISELKNSNYLISSLAGISYTCSGNENRFKAIGYLAKLSGDIYKEQLKIILNGKKLAINFSGGYFALPKDCTIEKIKPQSHKIFKSILSN